MQHGQCSGVKKEPYDTVEHDRWSGMKVKKEEQQELNQDNVWAKLGISSRTFIPFCFFSIFFLHIKMRSFPFFPDITVTFSFDHCSTC